MLAFELFLIGAGLGLGIESLLPLIGLQPWGEDDSPDQQMMEEVAMYPDGYKDALEALCTGHLMRGPDIQP